MFEGSQNWELFGYDMRKLGRTWTGAWRELLFAPDSPVRSRLDDVVAVRSESGEQNYHGGELCTATTANFSAIALPDELVLDRQLSLPLAAEDELDAVIGLEVQANSPFSPDDTAYGWRLVQRSERGLSINLVIVSLSAVMTYLARKYDSHDPRAQEVWANADGAMVVLQGFGEGQRGHRYRKRLINLAALVSAGLIVVLCLVATSAFMKRLEVGQLQTLAAATQRQASEAVAMRETLMRANSNIAAANEVVALYPNPHIELARLTRLLGDDAFLSQFAMTGTAIRLRGQSADAASVMQLLTDQPIYTEVTAPQAITRIGNSGLEQFFLNMTTAAGDSP